MNATTPYKPKMTADYKAGGGWGDTINWFPDGKQFKEKPLAPDAEYQVVGWKSKRPVAGETLMAEFKRCWMKFRFVSVEYVSNPNDMFFATVAPIEQEMKP
jgi:hypothetical protein